MSSKQRIGLFGGTFDPIHIGHLIVAESILTDLKLDLIFFIPTHKHAIKHQENITSPNVRLGLLKIALNGYPHFQISEIELDRNNVSYTVDTLNQFANYEKLENIDLFNIIGEDNLHEIHLWKNPEQIVKLSTLVVLRRPKIKKTDLSIKYDGNIINADTPLIDISSTMIRERIRNNLPWKSLVLPDVYDYIEKHQLYR